jgi:hypothetical protein
MLVEGVVSPLELDKPIGIVHPALFGRKMIYGAVVVLHDGSSFFLNGKLLKPELVPKPGWFWNKLLEKNNFLVGIL